MVRGTIQTEHMQDVLPGLPEPGIEEQQVDRNAAKARSKTSSLKFYIHDSAAYFRIELIGELAEIDLGELVGCWHTAKSSIAGRKLAIDVRHLKSLDDDGRQWLDSMVREGACYITGKDRSGVFQVRADWRPGGSNSNDRKSPPKLLRALLRMVTFSRLPALKPTR
ncbi:MAG: hypothetical protein WA324_16685 [Bryobacteraceae bacterium]